MVKDPVTGDTKKEYTLPFNAELHVRTGDKVEPGTVLNIGSYSPLFTTLLN